MSINLSFFFKSTLIRAVKRSILVLFLSILTAAVQAKNYYFSSSTGNDAYSSTQAQSEATPWKSISKLNSFFGSIVAGDNIFFKRGDVFYGSIVVTKSGSSANQILFGAYGSGNKPVITGFTTLSSWTSLGNNIYQTNVSGASATLNMVSINGIPQRIGRFPNYTATADPYLYYESLNSNGTSITDNQLTSATNWTGAEVVIRKRRWILDRCKITNHSGSTITYTNPNDYPGLAGFGYFFQNDPRTIDLFGEWYLNPSTKNLQIHFGGNQPTAYSVKASSLNDLLTLGSNSYITIENLSFEGANVTALSSRYGSNITVRQCDFSQMGADGVLIIGSPNVLLENLSLSYILNNPIRIANNGVSNAVVRSCSIKNSSLFPGMGTNGDGTYQAMSVQVNSGATIEYNAIDSVGYNGIDFQGNNVTVQNNFINNYCNVKDDGGGIYTWVSNTSTANSFSNRKIYNNILLNAKGEPYGTSGKTAEAKGIYMDGGSMNVEILNNSIANISRTGILLNNSTNVKMNGNTVFNSRFGIEMVRLFQTFQVRNIEMKKNIIYPVSSNQNSIYYKNFFLATPTPLTIEQDMKLLGKFDSNYYATPSTIGFSYYACQDYNVNQTLNISPGFSVEGWKSITNNDASSKRPVKSSTTLSQLRFEYNATTSAKTITLDAKYIDVEGTAYNGTVTLQPYTSKILLRDGDITVVTPPPPPVSSTLTATASVPAINCAGGNTTVTVVGSGGTTPYLGTGNFSTNPGIGSLKISFPTIAPNNTSILYSTIGAISAGKNYILRFSTLGTTNNGQLKVILRKSSSPFNLFAPILSNFFGTTKVDHEYLFTATDSDANARFDIEINQGSGTTYIDNIAFFEATSTSNLISSNLFSAGQFETNIDGINVWSSNNNQVTEWDGTGKINSTNYYTVTDAKGAKSTIGIDINQPATPLTATATAAGNITTFGGTTTVTVVATGGKPPYTGTGTFTVKAGTSNFIVTDANSCSITRAVTVTEPAGVSTLTVSASSSAINCSGTTSNISISATGGTSPYTGTGNFSANGGIGSLKITFPTSVSTKTSVVYASVGTISLGKNYILRFSTLGTTENGQLRLVLRQSGSPYNLLAPLETNNFGATRVDHEYLFTPTSSDANGRFDIEINQGSGTTYIDNIAFFEATSTGNLISSNLFPTGQFETNIDEINVWSSNNNQVAAWDATGKINSTNYYTVTDAKGAKSTIGIDINQPATPLTATATAAGNITTFGGTTTVTVAATGGKAPYTGTGTFTVKAGTSSFTVTDANSCSVTKTVTVTETAGGSALTASANASAINCSGTTSNISISATGGTSPYTGTGNFSANGGIGSLKITFPTSISTKSSVVYASVGTISLGKSYILRFSTLGTTANGQLKLVLRQSGSPYNLLAPLQTNTFGTTKVDHEYLFTPTASDANGRFDIEINQASGITYIDNIAFFEATSARKLISNNLFSPGQFENNISGINIWSSNNNQVASWDGTAKIKNINYYTVTDAKGVKSTVGIIVNQSATPLVVNVNAGTITTVGGSTTATVSASGGTAPYIGTGTFTIKAGTSNFTVTDANGCSKTTSITVSQTAARISGTSTTTTTVTSLNVTNINNPLQISTYPNPTNAEFGLVVEGGTNETVQILVMTTEGKIIFSNKGTTNTTYKFGNNFAPGLYIIKVVQGNTILMLKAIKI